MRRWSVPDHRFKDDVSPRHQGAGGTIQQYLLPVRAIEVGSGSEFTTGFEEARCNAAPNTAAALSGPIAPTGKTATTARTPHPPPPATATSSAARSTLTATSRAPGPRLPHPRQVPRPELLYFTKPWVTAETHLP